MFHQHIKQQKNILSLSVMVALIVDYSQTTNIFIQKDIKQIIKYLMIKINHKKYN